MRQFGVYENRNPASRARYPYLLNVQSDLIEQTETRVAVPLFAVGRGRSLAITSLTPVLEVAGRKYLLLTPLLAGIDTGRLGKPVADLSHERAKIVAALDFLITGI